MSIQLPKNPFDHIASQIYAGQVTEQFHRLGDWVKKWIDDKRLPDLRFAILFWHAGEPNGCNYVSNCDSKQEMIDAWDEQLAKVKEHPSIVKPPNLL